MADPFTKGAAHLNSFQVQILDECLLKGSGGMALPMGTGKTLLSTLVALQLSGGKPILFVAAKTLIATWLGEFKKFFGDTLSFTILHSDKKNLSNVELTNNIILTTPDVIAKVYRQYQVANKFIHYENVNPFVVVKNYRVPDQPYLNHTVGAGLLYSIKWGVLVIDEAQGYTNINVSKCQSLAALCAEYRWALSGTMFDEPKPERILGYYLLINDKTVPRNLPELTNFIKSNQFEGLQHTLVKRVTNEPFKPPKVNEVIVSHDLSPPESKIYLIMKETLTTLRKRLEEYKRAHDVENIKRFSSYLLAVITYLRQGLICSVIPIASVAMDIVDLQCKSELSEILNEEIKKAGLHQWLSDPNAVKSTRITKALQIIDKHPERIVIFSCFSSCLNVFKHFLPTDRKIFMIKASMSLQKRGQVIEEFSTTKGAILLLTFDLGANGLNLQTANTCLLLDFWWNAGKTKQAVARILRYGQQASSVNVYYFKSNTALELMLFKKQQAKLIIAEELYSGKQQTVIPTIKMKDILNMIEQSESSNLLKQVYQIK